jgi:hypothetical protein
MVQVLREQLGLTKAKVKNLAGRGGGFFIPYSYAGEVAPLPDAYQSVLELCERAPWADFVAEMQRHEAAFRAFGSEPDDPSWGGEMLPPLDAVAAYAAVRMFRPRSIVEVGSGDSTFFLVKASGPGVVTCIDPAPRRDVSGLPVKCLQRVLKVEDEAFIATLEPGDILFIDSSHIMLPGMDVDIIFNRLFPRLKPGVIVHLHDIFLPFGYPDNWHARNWNEQNALIGWLFGAFDIVYPGHYVIRCQPQLVEPLCRQFGWPMLAGSIWLRKR